MAIHEPEFIRLGAMSTDSTTIKPRTLYEIREKIKPNKLSGGLRNPAIFELKRLAKEMTVILEPLTHDHDIFSATLLRRYGLLSEPQYDSLIENAKKWVRSGTQTENEMSLWLGDDRILAERRVSPEAYGIEIEEPDLEFEQ